MQELWPSLSKLDKTIIEVDLKNQLAKFVPTTKSPIVLMVKMAAYIDQKYPNEIENDFADFLLRLWIENKKLIMEANRIDE